jgi:hypothetical protein
VKRRFCLFFSLSLSLRVAQRRRKKEKRCTDFVSPSFFLRALARSSLHLSLSKNMMEREEHQRGKTPFEILGLSESSEAREVHEAFKRLAKDLHPDVMTSKRCSSSSQASSSSLQKSTTRNFQAISHARDECLAIIADRNMYDNYSSNGEFGHHHHHHRMARSGGAAALRYARAPSHVSATSFGLVLAFPFVFGLSFLGSVMNASDADGRSAGNSTKYVEEIGRPNGVLHPPENAWLRDEVRSQTVSSPTFQKLVGLFGFAKSTSTSDSNRK